MLDPGQCKLADFTSAVLGGGSVPPQAKSRATEANVAEILETVWGKI